MARKVPKFIIARIPVVISSNGRWAANGYPGSKSDPDWAFLEDQIIDGTTDDVGPLRRIWIEVELPVPQIVEVRGLVRPDPVMSKKRPKKGQSLPVVR